MQQQVLSLAAENTEENWTGKLALQVRQKKTQGRQEKNGMTNTTVPTVGSTPNVAYPGSTTAENKSTSGSFTSVLGVYFMLYVNWLVCIIYGKNLAESRDIVKDNKEVLPGEEEKYMQQLCTFKIGKGRLDIPAPEL